MPLIGERMTAFRMSVSIADRLACDCATCASVLASSACARFTVASCDSISWREGTRPPLNSLNLLQPGEVRFGFRQRRLRLQSLRLGRLQPRARLRGLGLELLGVHPRQHLSNANGLLKSTSTDSTTPEISVPMFTCVSSFQLTGGGDGHGQRALLHRFGLVRAGSLCRRCAHANQNDCQRDNHQRGDDPASDAFASPARRESKDVVDVGGHAYDPR